MQNTQELIYKNKVHLFLLVFVIGQILIHRVYFNHQYMEQLTMDLITKSELRDQIHVYTAVCMMIEMCLILILNYFMHTQLKTIIEHWKHYPIQRKHLLLYKAIPVLCIGIGAMILAYYHNMLGILLFAASIELYVLGILCLLPHEIVHDHTS